ncbi:MAG: acetyl-CoA carboxyl transferase [Nitrospiraceae bacterium]|nr:acetyl-CoA carboxyl transferase [Nitrospiraceae bacterium]
MRAWLRARGWLLIAGIIVGGGAASVGAILTANMVEATNTAEFCAACHEMEVFRETWAESPHGTAAKGIVSAICVDCHLPPAEDGIVHYLYAKGMSGIRDLTYHTLGIEPDWVANLERREEYTMEESCRKCHLDLVAPEIPLKAYLAHRDYTIGQTTETCISCHSNVGHGNLKHTLTVRNAARTAAAQAQ